MNVFLKASIASLVLVGGIILAIFVGESGHSTLGWLIFLITVVLYLAIGFRAFRALAVRHEFHRQRRG